MKRILLTDLTLCFPLVAFAQAPPRVTFTASHVQDSGGSADLPTGKLCFVTTDANDKPMGYRIGTGSGQTSASPDQAPCATVTAGAISPIQIINSAASSPLNACIRVVTKDAGDAEIRRSKCVQTGTADALTSWCSASGGTVTCNWDQYPIGTIPIPLVQQGGKGDKGDKGDNGTNGTNGCAVGSGLCDTVVSLNPSTDQDILQPEGTHLQVNGEDVLTQDSGVDVNLSAVFTPKSLSVTGDSYVGDNSEGGHCFGASDAAHCWWAVLAKQMHIPEANWYIQGIGGTTFSNQAPFVFGHIVSDTGYQLFAQHTAINDCNDMGCTDSGSGQAFGSAPGMFYKGLLAEALWDLTPENMKVRGSNCTGAGWSSDATYTYGVGAQASAQGTTCTFKVKASNTVFVGYTAKAGDGGAATIDVDGGSGAGGSTTYIKSQLATNNVNNPIIPGSGGQPGTTYAPQVVAIPVSYAGEHTVTVTVTSTPTTTFTGTTMAGSNIVTGVTVTSGAPITMGATISGPGIPSSTVALNPGCCTPDPTTFNLVQDGYGNFAGSSSPATSSGTSTFTAGSNAVHLLYVTGNAVAPHPGMPMRLIAGMPASGQFAPYCANSSGYPDKSTTNYDNMTRQVAADLRGWNYNARWVNERATQNGTTVTFTATTFSGSPVLTVSSSDGVQIGDSLYHTPNIIDGSVVVAVSGNQVTINQAATGNGTSASGVSHWFYASGDCIHPSNNGYAILGNAAAAVVSGTSDAGVQPVAAPYIPPPPAVCTTYFPCLAGEFHVSGQSAGIGNTALVNFAVQGTYRYCANAAVTSYSSSTASVRPFVVYTGKYNTGSTTQVPAYLPVTPLQSFSGSYPGYDTARISGNNVPIYNNDTTNVLSSQGASGVSLLANVLTAAPNCVVFTAKANTAIYAGADLLGTNAGGTYALDATLEQLTKQ